MVLVGQAHCVAQSLHEKKSDTDSNGVDLNLYGSFQLLPLLKPLAPPTSEQEHHHHKGEKRNWPHPGCPLQAEIPLLHVPPLHGAKNQDAGEGIDVASKIRDCKQTMLFSELQK